MKKTTKTGTKRKESESSSEDYYTIEEVKKLDEYQMFTENKFSDDEIYEVMQKHKGADEAIRLELKEMLNELQRGDFSWKEVGAGKS